LILLFAFSYQLGEFDIAETSPVLSQAETYNVLYLGTEDELRDLDPLNAWDFGSFDVIEQVAEGLFGHNFSDPDLGIIPKLAAGYGTWVGNRYTVDLKPDVEFHDGTPFDAYAVESTFTRLQHFMDNGWAKAGSLYRYYDYETDEIRPIINTVTAKNDLTVEFEVNGAFGILEPLLAFEAAFILSPTATPPTEYIDKHSGLLVGTGPFVQIYF